MSAMRITMDTVIGAVEEGKIDDLTKEYPAPWHYEFFPKDVIRVFDAQRKIVCSGRIMHDFDSVERSIKQAIDAINAHVSSSIKKLSEPA